jgi:hypothetical protein
LEKSTYAIVRRIAGTVLALLIVYQFVLVMIIAPLFSNRFGETRIAGKAIEQAISAAPAPTYCLHIDTNVFFYLRVPLRCLDLTGMAALAAPGWLLVPLPAVTDFAKLRPDLAVRVVVGPVTEAQLTATRIDNK